MTIDKANSVISNYVFVIIKFDQERFGYYDDGDLFMKGKISLKWR